MQPSTLCLTQRATRTDKLDCLLSRRELHLSQQSLFSSAAVDWTSVYKMSTLTSFSGLRPSPTVTERIVKNFTRQKVYNMKTEACLPLVFRPRRLEGHPSRRFVLAIRQKKRLDSRRPRAIGRGQSISGKTTTPVSSLLSRIGRRGVQKRDAEGGHGALLVGGGDGEGDDACRSFEKYVMDVVLEDGRVGDLRDVEELLHCWSNLLCPVLADIVATFYVEACKELFTPD